MAEKDSKRPAANQHQPGDGFRGVRTTSLFRAVNFELFVKPNKVVMAFGLTVMTGIVVYFGYMNAMAENKKDQIYVAYNHDGSVETKRKSSKWD
ncbi:small integral membrane protein 8-like [Glandiceps talaboti]